MKSNYKLGELIRAVDNKNRDLHCTNLKGLSMSKEFRPSTSNIVGTDLSKYKIVSYKQFACDFMSAIRVHRIPIAFNFKKEEILVSPAYAVFEVINENIIIPEYLMMWFSRSEFDRYVDFRSDAAIRGGYGWNELCDTVINIPNIEKQKKIVDNYKAITDRIALKKKINDNLEATVQAIYKSFFVDFELFDFIQPESWKELTIDDIAKEVVCGKTPPTADAENYGGSVPFITIPDMHGSVYTTSTERFLSDKGVATQANKTLPENSICVSCIASVGLVCLTAEPSQTNQQINSIICKESVSPFYVYIKMTTLTEYLKQLGAGGSTTLNVNKTLFGQIPILLPEESVMKEFHGKVEPLFSAIRANQYEMQHLESLKSLLLTQISSR